MSNPDTQNRDYSLDLIRCFAVFSVISVHFFRNTGYYNVPLEGEKLLLMTMARSFFMVCVPLFIMLTGYLQNKKTVCMKYYMGIFRILVTYLLASLACLLFRHAAGEDFTIYNITNDILGYTMAPYGWYVEMYLGLFLLTPFLNVLWNNLSDKKQKHYLILTMIILTTLPSICNILHFDEYNSPNEAPTYLKLLPFWWKGMWPVTYYFLGCYIQESQTATKKIVKLPVILLLTITTGIFNFCFSKPGVFVWGIWSDWFSLPVVALSVLVFIFLLNIDTARFPVFLKKLLYRISTLSFGAYLVSYIFDKIFYDILNANIKTVTDKIPYFFVIVPIILIYSLALSYLLDLIWKCIQRICKMCNK